MIDTSFFVGHLTMRRVSKSRLRRLRVHGYNVMHRNALPATAFLRIPPNCVVELGG